MRSIKELLDYPEEWEVVISQAIYHHRPTNIGVSINDDGESYILYYGDMDLNAHAKDKNIVHTLKLIG